MLIAGIIVLFVWCITSLSVLFCLRWAKWMDTAIQDEGVGIPVMGVCSALAGVVLMGVYKYFPEVTGDSAPLVFGAIFSAGSGTMYIVFWVALFLIPFHKQLRRRKNY